MEIYVVRPNDTIDIIAAQSGTDIYTNQLVYPYRLAVGQALLLSPGTGRGGNSSSIGGDMRRTVCSGGYAYPFISRWVLEQTLPYLTDISVFSYGFTVNGDLIPPAVDDVTDTRFDGW